MYVVVLECVRDLKQDLAEVNSLAVFIKEPELEVLQGWGNSRCIYLFKFKTEMEQQLRGHAVFPQCSRLIYDRVPGWQLCLIEWFSMYAV